MSEDKQIYVGRFKNHPLGGVRYLKDYRRSLTSWSKRPKEWWLNASEEDKYHHFEFFLNHPQYHHSTGDLNRADFFYMDEDDQLDRDILAKYCKYEVEYLPISIGISK